MEKDVVIRIQEKVTQKVEALSKDVRYQNKTSDIDHPEKLNPFVVATLVGEKTNITSYRSELFNGDHAEYNLFLQKLSGEDHSDDILFVSLEPCNHDSRLKTISCSELIVKAGIKTVYMGTFDPDPMVRGDGYAYLINNGVEVILFEERYHAKLIDANKKFYISKIIDDESFNRFLKKYKYNFDLDSISFDAVARDKQFDYDGNFESIYRLYDDYKEKHKEDILKLFYDMSKANHYIDEIVVDSRRDFWFDDGFKLAFYKNPNTLFKGSYFRVISYNGPNENASKTFNGPIFKCILETLSYIFEEMKKVVSTANLEKVRRIIREMVVNAACHKNYNSFSPIIIKLKNDAVEIFNPFVNGKIDVGKMNSFNMPTNPVNGCLTEIAISEHFMEGQGRGSADLKKYLKSLGMEGQVVYEAVCDILITTIPLPLNSK